MDGGFPVKELLPREPGPKGSQGGPKEMDTDMQTTLIILKPDSIQRGLMGKIISRFEEKGFQIVGAKMTQLDKAVVEKHYEAHRGKPFFEGVVRFMSSSPVLVMAIYGKNAIAVCRKMMGATASSNAEPGTIRGDFGLSAAYNLIHGSDSPESAERELGLFFKQGEITTYPRLIDPWVYSIVGQTVE